MQSSQVGFHIILVPGKIVKKRVSLFFFLFKFRMSANKGIYEYKKITEKMTK